MENYENNKNTDGKLELQQLIRTFARLLIIGAMVTAVANSVIHFIKGTTWSFGLLMTMILPAIVNISIYIIIAMNYKKYYME